jgi:alkanesulfonate monooxygenase SsuD/methylene tetrahydromethanopterin reductase-like flavin-dependent oxidoreductase (luciferase family)
VRTDGRVEIHIVSFPSREALDNYRADARRHEHLHLLRESQAVVDLLEVADVSDETG